MLSIRLTSAPVTPRPLRLLSRKEAARRDPARYPRPQCLVVSPIQAGEHLRMYDIDTYIQYICVPAETWRLYVRRESITETAHVLPFARQA